MQGSVNDDKKTNNSWAELLDCDKKVFNMAKIEI